jgi:hypothetical protein
VYRFEPTTAIAGTPVLPQLTGCPDVLDSDGVGCGETAGELFLVGGNQQLPDVLSGRRHERGGESAVAGVEVLERFVEP